ncbi:MAG: hypothetical protein KME45_02970 [Stenomitos rutilans HA7619-LM2]|jgi:hypothetical protein|nr:hypothetical protein [Stenomitos rutilans HA7619-LM2]MBW4469346.1 hypothetical protein [Stenomitos rutilans HA7619-LM2]
MTHTPLSSVPALVWHYCQQHNYSEPFFNHLSREWYAFSGKDVLPIALPLPTAKAKGVQTALRGCWLKITLQHGGVLTYRLEEAYIVSAVWEPCPLFCQQNPGVVLQIGTDLLELGDGVEPGSVWFRFHANHAFMIPPHWHVFQDNEPGSIVKAVVVAVEYQEVEA